MAIFAPWVAPADPLDGSMINRLKPIGTEGYPWAPTSSVATCSRGSSGAALLAPDGRDAGRPRLFHRQCDRHRRGLCRRPGLNAAIMRTIDVFYAFPSVLLAVAISGALGRGLRQRALSLTVVFIPPIARIAES
jgi:peptide/nickel transport system permease protein